MADLTTIETAARVYSEEIRRLMELVGNRDAEVDVVNERYELDIRRQFARCEKSLSDTYMYVEESPAHFQNPKTKTFGNIKVGYIKQKDSVEHQRPELVIQRIRQLMPDRYDELVRTELTLSKEALRNLTSAEMDLIGVTLIPGGDIPSVSLMDKEAAKRLKAMEKAQKSKAAAHE